MMKLLETTDVILEVLRRVKSTLADLTTMNYVMVLAVLALLGRLVDL